MHYKYAIIALLACSASACSSNAHDELSHHHHDHNEAEHSASAEIHLEPDAAELFGVEAITIQPGSFNDVIAVSGQIIDNPAASSVVTAPTAGIVTLPSDIAQGASVSRGATIATISAASVSGGDPNRAAKAALDAARRELDRLTPLHADGIISTRDYNAALQAYEQARAAYSPAAATGRAAAPTAGIITSLLVTQGQYVEAGAPIAQISGTTALTLRADLPERHLSRLSHITGAKMRLPYSDTIIDLSDRAGRKITLAAAAPTPGYIPVYFTFDNPKGEIIPGSSAQVYLIGAERQDALTVPIAAISEQQGQYFVYEKLDEDCYRKLPVTTGATDGQRIEITSGLKGGEQIVVKGTTSVRLAESSSVVPEGHSHNH